MHGREKRRVFSDFNSKTTFKWMNEKNKFHVVSFHFIFLCQLKYQRIPFYYLHCANNTEEFSFLSFYDSFFEWSFIKKELLAHIEFGYIALFFLSFRLELNIKLLKYCVWPYLFIYFFFVYQHFGSLWWAQNYI